MKSKSLDQKTEKWWKRKHTDIETSAWIPEEMKCAYRNLLTQAYKDGYQSAVKDNISVQMKG